MELTDWIVILAIVLIAIAFFCSRTPARWSRENRARRFTGTRLLVQAAFALWAAVLIVVRGFFVLAFEERDVAERSVRERELRIDENVFVIVRKRRLVKAAVK